jgi:hypothetical protein
MQHLDLSDEEAASFAQELHAIVENDRYPLSPRIRTLRGILAKLRPESVREPFAAAEGVCSATSNRSQNTPPWLGEVSGPGEK